MVLVIVIAVPCPQILALALYLVHLTMSNQHHELYIISNVNTVDRTKISVQLSPIYFLLAYT